MHLLTNTSQDSIEYNFLQLKIPVKFIIICILTKLGYIIFYLLFYYPFLRLDFDPKLL